MKAEQILELSKNEKIDIYNYYDEGINVSTFNTIDAINDLASLKVKYSERDQDAYLDEEVEAIYEDFDYLNKAIDIDEDSKYSDVVKQTADAIDYFKGFEDPVVVDYNEASFDLDINSYFELTDFTSFEQLADGDSKLVLAIHRLQSDIEDTE
ncbi:hypothetical protein [Lactobacillus jensenii]|uniref:Uncharacterized protein n=1 Tax=Lactobacillus jensenii TaxID=109790 RepID=A0ABU9FIB0_LACJE|nr:hypothetical protein [Lactobacillus jensenii]DAK37286.1 MAG TPA: hypothetical protein [Caudoviricetes sp.]MDK7295003.1 hypothetical protein [Lactobacillus jensenii]MDT9545278.1 hypothetical protein [Lactobacillus jensenii]PLA43724.1 hypothetical protein CYJ90_08330 [Lactobacillus jensenii]TVU98770.1 hypothetical protein FOF77_00170 [Lactobacillus jensenii]